MALKKSLQRLFYIGGEYTQEEHVIKEKMTFSN